MRTARSLADRVLSLLMPVKRYRCSAPGCEWEGLLLSRRQRARYKKRTLSRAAALARLAEGAAAAAPGLAERRPALMAFRARLP